MQAHYCIRISILFIFSVAFCLIKHIVCCVVLWELFHCRDGLPGMTYKRCYEPYFLEFLS